MLNGFDFCPLWTFLRVSNNAFVFRPEREKYSGYNKKADCDSHKLIKYINKNEIENTVYELILGESNIKKSICKSEISNLDVLPSKVDLAGAEIELLDVKEREYVLRNEIDWVKDDYDYIIIDCPPSLNLLTINALTTADTVLVPIQCEYYALEGLSQLIHTINLVQNRLNPNLSIEGVVFTMYDARTNLSLQVVENVKANLNQNVYKTIIPRNVRLAEAPSHGLPINI